MIKLVNKLIIVFVTNTLVLSFAAGCSKKDGSSNQSDSEQSTLKVSRDFIQPDF